MFLKNRNISSKIKRSKVTDYAALNMKTPNHGSKPPDLHHTFVVMFSFVTVIYLIYFDTSKSFVRYWLKYLRKAFLPLLRLGIYK